MTEEVKVIKRFKPFVLGKCQCGCNEDIPIRTLRGYLSRFKKYHQRKGKDAPVYKGDEIDTGPYKIIFRPDHPNASKRGYVRKHRLIYEHYLKILFDEDVYIPKHIEVHHIVPIDEGGTDAFINLEVKTPKDRRIHQIKDMSDRICRICGSDKTQMIKLGDLIRPKWYGSKKAGFICYSCYGKDPIIRQRATQLQKERRKRKRLEINTLSKYSN